MVKNQQLYGVQLMDGTLLFFADETCKVFVGKEQPDTLFSPMLLDTFKVAGHPYRIQWNKTAVCAVYKDGSIFLDWECAMKLGETSDTNSRFSMDGLVLDVVKKS